MLSWLVGFTGWPVIALKLAIAGLVATLLGSALSGAYAYNAGWRNAENAGKAAALELQQKHTTWLRDTAAKSGKLTADDAAIEVSNEKLQGAIENALTRPSTPRVAGVCVPDSFLRELAKFR